MSRRAELEAEITRYEALARSEMNAWESMSGSMLASQWGQWSRERDDRRKYTDGLRRELAQLPKDTP